MSMLLGSLTFNNVDFTVSPKGLLFDNEGGKRLFVPAHMIRNVGQADGKLEIGLIENHSIRLEGYDVNATFDKIVQGL